MGVPALFRWLSQKYPKIITPVIEEQPLETEAGTIPVDTTQANPNGEEMDNLYLDMNNIVHPCSHPEDKPAPETEEDMMLEVFKYTERIVNMVRPRKLLMIAVDGVAPRAKMNQQRSRRFRAAQEAREKNEEKEEFYKLLRSQNGGVLPDSAKEESSKKTWDSNSITPGTPFMDMLAASLRYWVAYKHNTDPAWKTLKVIISDATVPGEGEHKMMEFIRSQRNSPEYDPNTRHVIYGLDADLIMLGLATHEVHFRVLREDVFAQDSKPRTCRICGQPGHYADQCTGEPKQKEAKLDEKGKTPEIKPYIWLHVSVLREYLKEEMYVPNGFKNDHERALDDWVFMCFFVGNDFLPHLPSLEIREQGIDTLLAIWRDNVSIFGGYITKDGQLDLKKAQVIMEGLAKQEDHIFRQRWEKDQRMTRNQERRKREQAESTRLPKRFNGETATPNDTGNLGLVDISSLKDDSRSHKFGNLSQNGAQSAQSSGFTHNQMVNRADVASQANKSAAAMLKERLLGKKTDENTSSAENNHSDLSPSQVTGKRKADVLEEKVDQSSPVVQKKEEEALPEDTVKLWEEGYQDRYYVQKFHVEPEDLEFRHKVARAYVEGLAWVLLYYFQGCPSWTWYYPYHYAPFAADFKDIDSMDLKFEKGTPFRPFEQLMGVLPAASKHNIPEVFHDLMTNPDSAIIDFYPEDFELDLNGKKFAWQGVAILPFIDEKRLLQYMHERYDQLNSDDKRRNSFGQDTLLFSESHPLYNVVSTNFYSKKQGAPMFNLNMKISEGLAGKVIKNEDYLPGSILRFPGVEGKMPEIDPDHSINVHYAIPHSDHVHKSMLLRGVVPPKEALTPADKAETRSRASQSGRNGHGHHDNRRGGRGGGRGGNGNNHRSSSYGDSYQRRQQSYPQQNYGMNPSAPPFDPQFMPVPVNGNNMPLPFNMPGMPGPNQFGGLPPFPPAPPAWQQQQHGRNFHHLPPPPPPQQHGGYDNRYNGHDHNYRGRNNNHGGHGRR